MFSKQWVIGFLEGEGWLYINILSHRNKGKVKYTPNPCLGIGIHEKDVAALEEIRDFFGVGKIYFKKGSSIAKKQKLRAGNQVWYVVSGVKNCKIIYEKLINEVWHTSKRRTFDFWVKAIKLMEEKKHLNKDGFREILHIRDSMNKERHAKIHRYASSYLEN